MPLTTKLGRMLEKFEGRSCDKIKTLYLYYHNTYGNKTWQYSGILWTASTH